MSVCSVPANPMPGWTVTSGNVEIIRLPTWAASEGEQSLDLNGVQRGTIQRTVSGFTVGNDDELRFDMGGNVYAGSSTNFAAASIGGTADTFSYPRVPGDSASDFTWEAKTLSFTAEVNALLLSFSDRSNGAAAGAALDNIRIMDPGGGASPVPLPAGGVLLLFALGAIALRRIH